MEDRPLVLLWSHSYAVSTDTYHYGETVLMNQIIKAAIAAFTRAKVPFSTADVVQAVTAGMGSSSAIRPNVLGELRHQINTAELQSVAVTSPQGNYGWLYTGVDQMVLPEGYAVRNAFTQVPAEPVKKGRAKKAANLQSSNDWMAAKGWTLPSEQAPTGWDMTNFFRSFYEEQVTEQEFIRRWNFSYDPEQTLAVPEDFYRSFIAQLEAATAVKKLDLLTSIQAMCLDKPDIESVINRLQAAELIPLVNKAQVVDAAIDCQTVGDLLSMVYTANTQPANAQPATPA